MDNQFGKKILSSLLEMLADETFRSEVIAIKKKFHIPENGINEEFYKKYGMNYAGKCSEELNDLLKKYKLNKPYHQALISIAIFGKIPDQKYYEDIKPFDLVIHKEKGQLDCPAIIIYPETSIKDIQKNWNEIKKFRKKIYGHEVKNFRPLRNSLRNYNIRMLKSLGVSSKKISKVINKVFNCTIGYEDIAKINDKSKQFAKKRLNK